MRGFTFYFCGQDYFLPCESRTYRTKAIAEEILTRMGKPITPANTEYIRERIQHCTLEDRPNGYLIHGNGFGIVDPRKETIILS